MKDLDKKRKTESQKQKKYPEDDAQREAGDYIKTDHSDYNRSIDRFGWKHDSEDE